MGDELQPSSRRSARVPGVARHGRLKRHSPWKTLGTIVASTLAVVLVSVTAVGAYAAIDLVNTAQPSVRLGNEEVLEGVPDVGAIEGGVNLLVIGSDSRQGQGMGFGDPDEETAVLNDVTMLLHVAQDHSNASVISFPRDMLVSVPECDDPEAPGETLSPLSGVKINTVLSYGGMPCVVKTIESLTGVTIPFAGVVQFMGVAGLSDAIGGVDVCVAEQIDDDYTGIHLEPGVHTLQGVDALQFLRTRHGVGDGSDLGRISNQQVFLSSLARKMQSSGTLGNPATLFGIAKAALANMTLSDSLTNPTTMVTIAMALKDIDLSKLAFIQYPTGYVDGGGAVVPTSSAEVVNSALQQDIPVVFDTEAQLDSGISSQPDPNAAPPETSTPEPDLDTDGDGVLDQVANTDTDGDGVLDSYVAPVAPVGPPVEALPSDVLGQTGAETRCSVANWD